jgi:hypothetical protein
MQTYYKQRRGSLLIKNTGHGFTNHLQLKASRRPFPLSLLPYFFMRSLFAWYKRLERPILYIIIAEFFVQLVNVTFMNVQPLMMKAVGFQEDAISAFTSFRFLGVLLLAVPLGFLITGKKVMKLFYLSAVFVPLFGLAIVYAIHVKSAFLIYSTQILWGASFTFIQIPIIPFIMRNAKTENHTAGIALSYSTWSFAGIASGFLVYVMDKINPVFFDEKMVTVIICMLGFAGLWFLYKAKLEEKTVERA